MTNAGTPRVMRWFTHNWHTGGLSDQEYEAACSEYERHLAALSPVLPAGAQKLSQMNLHDGQVQEWTLDGDRFFWRLLIGDLERGYEFADVVYHDAELVGIDPEVLRALRIDREAIDLVSDELDETADGRLEHRFYFWSGPEFGIRFSRVHVLRTAAPSEARR